MRFFLCSGICLVIAVLALGAGARDLGQDEALRLREQGKIIALEELMVHIKKTYPDARLLEVELEHEDGIYMYEVELLTQDGVVRELEIDARNGTVLQDEVDD
jgi:uncharacterized membrane protein YkoI